VHRARRVTALFPRCGGASGGRTSLRYHRQPIAGVLATLVLTGAAAAEEKPGCRLEALTTGTVQSVSDGRTFTLADGREVRLAGIEIPSATESQAHATRVALAALIVGREITLKRLGAERDRYGRTVAYAFIGNQTETVQQALLAQGHAQVAARVGDAWTDPAYGMRRAEHPTEVLAERGRFTLVEGKVLSVRESGATIYVNFGRRWSEDFTVTVQKRAERAFAAAGLELKKLAGRHVRVRGFIEERGGPWIEASRPEQIEIADRN
jgi:endonuclease YncB( thermonuclease family)